MDSTGNRVFTSVAASVASVTVTHNSAKMLPAQLEALCRQSRCLNEIIVVDNASTDSTRELLRERYPYVTLVALDSNTGVGGAISAGLSYAIHERNYDWVWILDHDSIPQEDCLERLFEGFESARRLDDNTAVLAPIAVHRGINQSYPGLWWRKKWLVPHKNSCMQPVCFVDAVISSGSLMRAEAVRRVGLPRADFFMDYVDFEHCLRLRREGYGIAVVRDSFMDHAIGDPKLVKLFGFTRKWADHVPWREYYIARNQVFTMWKYFPDWKSKLSILWRIFRHACGIALLGTKRKECLKMLYLGLQDGFKGRLGIRFLGDASIPGSELTAWSADDSGQALNPDADRSEMSIGSGCSR